MSNTAFKRDLSDPKTIMDFSELVQSPERLRLLLCLTVADIRAVGPGRWNGWKAALLRELYYRTEDVLTGGLAAHQRDRVVTEAQAALRARLGDWDDARFETHKALGPPSYWLAFDTDTLERQARFVGRAEREGLTLALDQRIDAFRAVTEITIYTADHPGVFSAIAGAFAVSGANIVDARINTLNNGMALDTFWVQDHDGAAIDRPDKLAKLSANMEKALSGRLRPAAELARLRGLPSRTKVFKVPPRVLIDNKASNTRTVIEVNGRDRPGLLYDLTRALTETSLQIASAKISTFGEEVVDVFYVKDIFGMKVQHESKLQAIHTALLEALRDPACEPAPVKRGGRGGRSKRRDERAAKPVAAE